MAEKRKITLSMTITAGSDHQHQFITDVVRTIALAISENVKYRHKGNVVEYHIEGANKKIYE